MKKCKWDKHQHSEHFISVPLFFLLLTIEKENKSYFNRKCLSDILSVIACGMLTCCSLCLLITRCWFLASHQRTRNTSHESIGAGAKARVLAWIPRHHKPETWSRNGERMWLARMAVQNRNEYLQTLCHLWLSLEMVFRGARILLKNQTAYVSLSLLDAFRNPCSGARLAWKRNGGQLGWNIYLSMSAWVDADSAFIRFSLIPLGNKPLNNPSEAAERRSSTRGSAELRSLAARLCKRLAFR